MGDIRIAYIKEVVIEGESRKALPGEFRIVNQSLAERYFREGLAVPYSDFDQSMIERTQKRQARIEDEPEPVSSELKTKTKSGKNVNSNNNAGGGARS